MDTRNEIREFLTTRRARITPDQAGLRTYGTGPAYRKLGGRVVYSLDDLRAWADRGTKVSTSDPGNGTVLPAKRHTPLPYAGRGTR